ncbi:hypothetical protein ERO13_A10G231683v2 [Gossypium hirsutum]|nr:hypothetical protein ERO13_A10G231683v2 [Gossypium hirsutum]
MASPSSSSPPPHVKYQVFLSFRGEDTRLNFISHLLKALKDRGMHVFFDEDKLEKGEQLSQSLSLAIANSDLSILVLSKDYASSKACLGELSHIIDRKPNPTDKHIVLPIFYHVDPSDVRNIDGSFKTSFEEHDSKRQSDEVQRWKAAFAKVGKLKGWHIRGCKFDRSETEYIKDIVEYVTKKLMNGMSRSTSDELIGIDDQKEKIIRLIEQEDCRVIGLWGMGGIGKTTLADAVYKEVPLKFENSCFLQNVSEKIIKQGRESLRNELLSELLNEKKIHIGTLSIGSPYRERMNNKKVIVILDDVSDPDQINFMGVKHFGRGSKIIVTSRDRQVPNNGGTNEIHEVKKLNANDSLQLFSTFAFKQLNPDTDFQNLSIKFVEYAQGNPLALRVLGSKLYKKSRKEWETEILRSSFDGLDELEKNIFLDIATFFKGELREEVEEILRCCYKGAECVISNLLDKSLLEIIDFDKISMHDMLEEMGKDIVRQESKRPEKQSRLWSPEDADRVLIHNKGTDLTKGIKVRMSPTDLRRVSPTALQNMHNLRFICIFFGTSWAESRPYDQDVDIAFLPNELRYFRWDYYPFKSCCAEACERDIVNLREINVSRCNKLRKIPNLLGAINLKRVICLWCVSLVELPCLNHLASLEELEFRGCHNLKKFPKVPNMFMDFDLSNTGIEEVPDSIGYLDMLEQLDLAGSRVKNVSSNILKLEKLHGLDLSYSMITEFPEIPNNLMQLNLSGTQIKEVSFCSNHLSNLHCLDMSFSSIQKLQCNIALFGSREIRLDAPIPILRFKNLRVLLMTYCDSLKLLSELPPYLQYFDANNCTSLEKVSFSDQNQDLYELHSCFAEELDCSMLFCNCFRLNQDSIDNIEANAMLKIRLLAKKWASKYDVCPPNFFSCFPGSKISASKFEYQSENSSLTLKIAPNGCNRSRFLAFSICLVADLIGCVSFSGFDFICEYQLTAASGGGHEKFRSEWHCRQQNWASMECMGDHVLILLSGDMVKNDKGYEQASFEFYIKYYGEEDIKVKKCGVHVSYVDEEPKSQPTA